MKKENMYTQNQYDVLVRLFNYYNDELFSGELPKVMITLSRVTKASGVFMPDSWLVEGGFIHEICFNPNYIESSYDLGFHQTLVHEMCHLWQEEYGFPSRRGYHNQEWADKMIEVGLMPSSTGAPGGSPIGQTMSDFVIDGGPFERAFKTATQIGELITVPKCNNMSVNHVNLEPVVKRSTRTKYTCECGNNVWGKRNLNIECPTCRTAFVAK